MAHGGLHTRAGECLKEAVTLWEDHSAAGSWQDLEHCGHRSSCWSTFDDRTCDPAGAPCWSKLSLRNCTLWKGELEQFMKNCSKWKDSYWSSSCRMVSCRRDSMLEQRKSMRSLAPVEEGGAEATRDELKALILHSSAILVRRK